MSDELVRVKIIRDGKHKTTVSLDRLMVQYAMEALGSDLSGFGAWLQGALERLERAWEEKLSNASIGEKIHPDAGLSRLLQRETLRMIVENAKKTPPRRHSRHGGAQPPEINDSWRR